MSFVNNVGDEHHLRKFAGEPIVKVRFEPAPVPPTPVPSPQRFVIMAYSESGERTFPRWQQRLQPSTANVVEIRGNGPFGATDE